KVDAVHVDRFLVVENRDEDREPDGSLRGRDRDHEEDEDLPLASSQCRAVSEQRQIGSVHHELDGEEDVNCAAPQESSGEAHAEKYGGSEKHVRERNGADHPFSSLRARTKAPTRAARRRTETASKWRRKSENRKRARRAGSPRADGSIEVAAGISAPRARSTPIRRKAKTAIARVPRMA